MNEDELKHIIAACRSGNARSQEDLYNAYVARLFGICRRYISDKDDAEDVLQETFIKIFTNIHQYKGAGSFEGWMKKIAVHASLHFLRDKKKFRFETIDAADLTEMEDEEDACLGIDQKCLFNCISELPLGYRTVLNLYLSEKFSHREIAAQLNIAESTSRSQLAKARRMLQELIKSKQSAIHERR